MKDVFESINDETMLSKGIKSLSTMSSANSNLTFNINYLNGDIESFKDFKFLKKRLEYIFNFRELKLKRILNG